MRNYYPLSSQEISDKILLGYENLIDLLGHKEDNYDPYSGLYDILETSGVSYLNTDASGIPHIGINNHELDYTTSTSDLISYLKFDYIYRKTYGEIMYEETKYVT